MNGEATQAQTGSPDPGESKFQGVSAARTKRHWKLPVFCLVAGAILGAGATGIAGWTAMPSMMLTVHESRYADAERSADRMENQSELKGKERP